MPDFTVHAYGTDTSGRTIYMTAFMHDWWESVVAALGFRPTIVQGAFMTRNGGGAADSAGYHDQGGCMDVRTWDLTTSQVDALVWQARTHGAAAWRRDKAPLHGGMDPHCHITLGSDSPLSAGAAESWRSYLAGDNGLAGNAPDYEKRPNPLVLTPPPEDDMTPEQAKTLDTIAATVERLEKRSVRQTQRVMGILRTIRGKTKDAQILAELDAIEEALAGDA